MRIFYVAGLLTLACILRGIHLIGDHYYIVNPDSFYFHQQAEWIGTYWPVLRGSGLAYPLWAVGKVISLEAACIVLPLLITAMCGVVIYWFAEKHWKAGLWSLFAYVVCWAAMFMGYAGMLDRDLTTASLVLVAMIGIYERQLIFPILAGLCLVIFWSWIGVFVIVCLALGYYALAWATKAPVEIPWKQLIALGVFGAIIMGVFHHEVKDAADLVFGYNGTMELGHNPLGQLLTYWSLLVPLGVGLALAFKTRQVFFVAWIAGSIILGIVSVRLIIFAMPAVCIVVGTGFKYMADQVNMRKVAYGCAVIAVGLAALVAIRPPQNILMPNDWVDACEYVKHNTPSDARVMSVWDVGWWISDVAEREPYVNNGFHPENGDLAVALVYTATSDNVAYLIMQDRARYLMVSTRENKYWDTIADQADFDGDKGDTLFGRALAGDFTSNWFREVYRNDTVVVLEEYDCECA